MTIIVYTYVRICIVCTYTYVRTLVFIIILYVRTYIPYAYKSLRDFIFRKFHKPMGVRENNTKMCMHTVQVCCCRPSSVKLKSQKLLGAGYSRNLRMSRENLYAYGIMLYHNH